MGVTPITPSVSNIDGKSITVAITYTSTNAAVETITLPTHMPKIDLNLAHPVLNIFLLVTEGDVSSGSIIFDAANEMKRGVAPDSASEWTIKTSSTIDVFDDVLDADGIAFVTYIPFGVQCS